MVTTQEIKGIRFMVHKYDKPDVVGRNFYIVGQNGSALGETIEQAVDFYINKSHSFRPFK